jgi:hypothetical protein
MAWKWCGGRASPGQAIPRMRTISRCFSWREILLPPCGINTLDDRHVRLCGNMVLYALRFKQRGISILDGHGCVWPGDGVSGQWELRFLR